MKIHKKNKIIYYIEGFFRVIFRRNFSAEKEIEALKTHFSSSELEKIQKRVNYYCKTPENYFKISKKTKIKDIIKPKNPKAYYFDTFQWARYFNLNYYLDFVFGDVVHIPQTASIVKSRPISEENFNSIILNLDKARHFVWVEDNKKFEDKKDLLIGRGAIYQEHRYQFYEKYFNNPLCDLGQVNKKGGNPLWIKPKISIERHLDYKFILSLQGNDVATNLKWIMSSNSIAVMPKPTIETWFMEGTLIADYHYIEIASDYSNLEEKLNFYLKNPQKCLEIIQNANEYCAQFWDKNTEKLCSLMVLEKYFKFQAL